MITIEWTEEESNYWLLHIVEAIEQIRNNIQETFYRTLLLQGVKKLDDVIVFDSNKYPVFKLLPINEDTYDLILYLEYLLYGYGDVDLSCLGIHELYINTQIYAVKGLQEHKQKDNTFRVSKVIWEDDRIISGTYNVRYLLGSPYFIKSATYIGNLNDYELRYQWQFEVNLDIDELYCLSFIYNKQNADNYCKFVSEHIAIVHKVCVNFRLCADYAFLDEFSKLVFKKNDSAVIEVLEHRRSFHLILTELGYIELHYGRA